jgi:predicted RNase H-like nuclease (RuvC/YqgF family)
MARRAVVEREELFKAANTLVAEGKEVSAMAVLNELGGGSLTTIYKYLAEWEAGRSAKISPAVSEPPEVVKNAFMSTWRVATMEADREVIAAREKADEEVKAAQKQFEGALQAIQRLEADSEADNAQIEELRKRIAELEGALTASSNDKAALKATSEQLQHQVNLQQTELERLHKV